MMTSSPGCMSIKTAASSSAAVQEGVSSVFLAGRLASNQFWHFLPNGPSPESLLLSSACLMYCSSAPVTGGLLNGIIFAALSKIALRVLTNPSCGLLFCERGCLHRYPTVGCFCSLESSHRRSTLQTNLHLEIPSNLHQ